MNITNFLPFQEQILQHHVAVHTNICKRCCQTGCSIKISLHFDSDSQQGRKLFYMQFMCVDRQVIFRIFRQYSVQCQELIVSLQHEVIDLQMICTINHLCRIHDFPTVVFHREIGRFYLNVEFTFFANIHNEIKIRGVFHIFIPDQIRFIDVLRSIHRQLNVFDIQ
ncbi:hypothetical protein D3C80_1498350 [compost metagenome]